MSHNTFFRRTDLSTAAFCLCSGLSLVACQGELKLNDGVARAPRDMAMAGSVIPAMIGFEDIYKDLDTPPGLGCTNQITACHGGTSPGGIMKLVDMSVGDMAKLMENYNEVLTRVSTSDPPSSVLLQKLLEGGPGHVGGKYFQDTNAPMYRRWLVWIQLGAKFESVSTMGAGGQ